jgi:alkylation response protein AidB-like acyl-CoA dehydrogenase
METDNHVELNQIRGLAERLAARELEAVAIENDRYPFAGFNWAAIENFMSTGLMSLTLPESHGGTGLGMQALATVLHCVATKDASMALMIFSQCLARDFLGRCAPAGTAEQWAAAPRDRSDILALPLYSDPEEPPDTLRATPTADGFELTGHVTYVACLPVAKAALIPAILGDDTAFFLVETNHDGVLVGDPVVSLGLRGCPVADMTLNTVVIPRFSSLSEEGSRIYADTADRYRGPLAAIALGILEGSYAAASEYAQERYQAKKQIIEHDMIRRMLANMLAWIDLGRAGAYHACQRVDQEDHVGGTESLSIQELLTMAAAMVSTDGVQVLGGYGYMREYGQEKRMRDAKQLQAVFGSSPVRNLRIVERKLEG